VPSGVTFGEWVEGALGDPPTYADLDYHLTTLFPPVRPQGHLEVRYIDTQRGDGWIVPAAVLWALTSDARALDSAVRAAEPFAGRWRHAARYGLADPGLALAAAEVLAAAQDALAADPAIAAAVGEFGDRYTFRGRSPADDWLPGELAPAGAPYCSMRGAVSGEAL
jgi:glutamate--cysteine ligase